MAWVLGRDFFLSSFDMDWIGLDWIGRMVRWESSIFGLYGQDLCV